MACPWARTPTELRQRSSEAHEPWEDALQCTGHAFTFTRLTTSTKSVCSSRCLDLNTCNVSSDHWDIYTRRARSRPSANFINNFSPFDGSLSTFKLGSLLFGTCAGNLGLFLQPSLHTQNQRPDQRPPLSGHLLSKQDVSVLWILLDNSPQLHQELSGGKPTLQIHQ